MFVAGQKGVKVKFCLPRQLGLWRWSAEDWSLRGTQGVRIGTCSMSIPGYLGSCRCVTGYPVGVAAPLGARTATAACSVSGLCPQLRVVRICRYVLRTPAQKKDRDFRRGSRCCVSQFAASDSHHSRYPNYNISHVLGRFSGWKPPGNEHE